MELRQDPRTGYWTKGAGEDKGYNMVGVHDPRSCDGRGCAIHNHPSMHLLFDAPLRWSDDAISMQRKCSHGKWHTDADEISYYERIGLTRFCTPECDACCVVEGGN